MAKKNIPSSTVEILLPFFALPLTLQVYQSCWRSSRGSNGQYSSRFLSLGHRSAKQPA
jgi:hypothetical protein